jgi:plasmid replication initiation protein
MISEKTDLVVKSNRLVEASYRLGLIEQRIILAAIVEARESQTGLREGHVSLEVSRFVKLFNMRDDSAYGQLKEALDNLYQRSVTITDTHPESGKERVSSIRWLSSKSYVDGAGIVQLRFTPEIAPYITRLEKEFTSYRLERVSAMTSASAIRLYELLIQYVVIGQRELATEEFKSLLGLEGRYEKFSALERYVIAPSIQQINEHSDIFVSWAPRKTGRKISHLGFTIRYEKESAARLEQKPKADETLIKKKAKPLGKKLSDAEMASMAKPGETWTDLRSRLSRSGQADLFSAKG